MYTTNSIEGYNRQLRKATKGAFPTEQAARKQLVLPLGQVTTCAALSMFHPTLCVYLLPCKMTVYVCVSEGLVLETSTYILLFRRIRPSSCSPSGSVAQLGFGPPE